MIERDNAFVSALPVCRRLVERTGVVRLPADIYRSELGPVPEDRFRIGVGSRDPEPALAALEAFLADDAG